MNERAPGLYELTSKLINTRSIFDWRGGAWYDLNGKRAWPGQEHEYTIRGPLVPASTCESLARLLDANYSGVLSVAQRKQIVEWAAQVRESAPAPAAVEEAKAEFVESLRTYCRGAMSGNVVIGFFDAVALLAEKSFSRPPAACPECEKLANHLCREYGWKGLDQYATAEAIRLLAEASRSRPSPEVVHGAEGVTTEVLDGPITLKCGDWLCEREDGEAYLQWVAPGGIMTLPKGERAMLRPKFPAREPPAPVMPSGPAPVRIVARHKNGGEYWGDIWDESVEIRCSNPLMQRYESREAAERDGWQIEWLDPESFPAGKEESRGS